jgi:Nucleotidyltransferase of unknown function (DUF6036)
MVAPTKKMDLWGLVLDRMYVDPNDLSEAVQDQVRREPLDFRTRLLIRDSIDALERFWGKSRLDRWLAGSPVRAKLQAIRGENLGSPGFPYINDQLMESTRREDVEAFLRELGTQVHRPLRMIIGGSIAMIVPGYLARRTQDIDVVDEIPGELRSQQKTLDDLMRRYRLGLAHFQSHYLPSGWDNRLHSLGSFGRLQVFLVDVYDVFLSKLFSKREKDRDDLRVVAPQLDKETLIRRLRDTAAALASDPDLRLAAEQNWYVLFGEPLPS